jgi:hypothetical protein
MFARKLRRVAQSVVVLVLDGGALVARALWLFRDGKFFGELSICDYCQRVERVDDLGRCITCVAEGGEDVEKLTSTSTSTPRKLSCL